MSRKFEPYISAILAIGLLGSALGQTAGQYQDATSMQTLGVGTASNCPNISWPMFVPPAIPSAGMASTYGTPNASGKAVPFFQAVLAAGGDASGYYKRASDGTCQPIPNCTGGQSWNSGAQACQCPTGQTLVSGVCTSAKPTISATFSAHAVPLGGSATFAWNAGGSGVSVTVTCSNGVNLTGQPASGGQTFSYGATTTVGCTATALNSGGSASASDSATWAAPPAIGLTVSPASQVPGQPVSFAWTLANATNASLVCNGSAVNNTTTSGSQSMSLPAPGSISCTESASDAEGSGTPVTVAANFACGSGDVWSATYGCIPRDPCPANATGTYNSGTQTWSCQCPTGQAYGTDGQCWAPPQIECGSDWTGGNSGQQYFGIVSAKNATKINGSTGDSVTWSTGNYMGYPFVAVTDKTWSSDYWQFLNYGGGYNVSGPMAGGSPGTGNTAAPFIGTVTIEDYYGTNDGSGNTYYYSYTASNPAGQTASCTISILNEI